MRRPVPLSRPCALLAALALATLQLPALGAVARDTEELRETTLNLIDALVEQGVLTRARADALIRDARERARRTSRKGRRIERPASMPSTAATPVRQADLAGLGLVPDPCPWYQPRPCVPAVPGTPAAGPTAAAAATTGPATAYGAVPAQAPAPAASAAPSLLEGDVRVTYVPETVRDRIRDELREEVVQRARSEGWATPGTVPDWVGHIRLGGDILLRAQANLFQRSNATQVYNAQAVNAAGSTAISNAFLYTNPADPNAVADNRQLLLLRARVGLQASLSDTLDAGLRLSTGNLNAPVVTVQTLGNSDNRYLFLVDQAYLHARPTPWLEASGGRIPNPFLSTELVWASDLGFEGVAATLGRRGSAAVSPWFTAGAFPLQELGSNAQDKWLYAAQAGLDWNLGTDRHARLGAAYYDYRNITGVANPTVGNDHVNDWTAPQYLQKGNTLFNIADTTTSPSAALFALAAQYRLLDLVGTVDLPAPGGLRAGLTGDYVRNLAYRQADVAARTGLQLAPRVTGYLLRLGVGRGDLAHAGDWELALGYRHLERDATLDAFTDPDFHLGGTDARGYTLGLSYALQRDATIGVRWLSANAIDGPAMAIDVLQVNFNARF